LLLPIGMVMLLFLAGCSVVDTILDDDTSQADETEVAEIVVVTDSAATADEQTDETPPLDAEETPMPDAEQSEAPVLQDETLSPTTGRPLPENSVYRPVLVVIDNAAQARPQTALMLADIVYEFPLDRTDHCTQYLAVFSDELPERVGPVRTSRSYFADVAVEWGGLYVSLGDPELADEEYPTLAESDVRFHVENSGNAANYFYRDKTITSLEEHTTFFKLRAYVDANYSFSVVPNSGRFAFESGVTYEKGKSFSTVGIPFTSSDSERVVFTYDKAKNLLVRSDKNSKNVLGESKSLTPTDDVLGYENVPITVQNLIVQYVRVAAFDTNFRDISLVGNGDCMYFINGRAISGSWSRSSLGEQTVYKLYDGTIVRLEPGTTWIMMMPSTHEIKVHYTG